MRELVESVSSLLRRRGLRLGVAESCTGGLLAATVTDVPGASDVFAGGFVAYSDEAKQRLLGLDAKKLRRHGAVSAWTTEAMAHGARERLACDMAIAVSGVAGPDGGSVRKPVGTVWIAIVGPEHLMDVRRLKFKGDRDDIRRQSVEAALQRAVDMIQEAAIGGVA